MTRLKEFRTGLRAPRDEHTVLIWLLIFFFSMVGCAHQPKSPTATPQTTAAEGTQNTALNDEPAAESYSGDLSNEPSNESDEFDEDEFDEEYGDAADASPELQIADPLWPLNRAMFHFNDKLYFWVLKPVARGYRAVVPTSVRKSVKNFFVNLGAPIRFTNSVLQGKGQAAAEELCRFALNSTVGLLGFIDVAANYPELKTIHDEDLGQTLATYGIGDGFYIVWPFFGPSTLRDTVGKIGDWFLSPINYVEPTEASVGITGFETVNDTSFRIGDYETLKDAALEPYEAFQNAYLQNRLKKIQE